MEVRFVLFRTTHLYWHDLMQKAAEFATTIPPGQLISISHSCDGADSVVAVWYWADIKEPPIEPPTFTY